VLAIRWLTQRRIQQLMNSDSQQQPQRPAFERHDPKAELRATVQPSFHMHDARHGSADAAAVREAFVTRSLHLFRRAVLLDVAAGIAYVLLLALLGLTARPSTETEGLTAGFVALGVVLQKPAWEPHAFTITSALLTGLLLLYGAATQLLLRREFVRSRAQLAAVLDQMEQKPRNLDLSFRRLEAMCHNDTWQIAVDEFAARSQALLMDLRGFSKERKGCQTVVDYLLDTVPLKQVLFLVDAGGDHALMQQMILERWEFLSPDSPNLHDRAPRVNIYVSSASDEADVQGILDLLMQAAQASSRALRPEQDRSATVPV